MRGRRRCHDNGGERAPEAGRQKGEGRNDAGGESDHIVTLCRFGTAVSTGARQASHELVTIGIVHVRWHTVTCAGPRLGPPARRRRPVSDQGVAARPPVRTLLLVAN